MNDDILTGEGSDEGDSLSDTIAAALEDQQGDALISDLSDAKDAAAEAQEVDGQALPAPGQGRPELEIPFAPPRTPVEESMVEIWQEILGLDQVGIHDNFLELGGNSLLASQVSSRVIKAFKVDLPLRLLFESPTVAEMAEAISHHQVLKADQQAIERMLAELEDLSDEQAKQLLADGKSGDR